MPQGRETVAELLTIAEVAARLRVSRRTVERLIAAGRIRTMRTSPGRVVVAERELNAYLAGQWRAA